MSELRTKFKTVLKSVENSIREGWDGKENLWFPHASLEGGSPTIAYGRKLTTEEEENNRIELSEDKILNLSEGITEKEADELFEDSFNTAETKAKKQWDEYLDGYTGEGDKKLFDVLDEKYQHVLTSIVFNVGSLVKRERWVWPKLRDAILLQDNEKVTCEMTTSYANASGKRMLLLTRRTQIARAIGVEVAL